MPRRIPLPLVRANQWFLIVAALASFVLQTPAGVLLALAVVAAGRLGGTRYHPVFAVARTVWGSRLEAAPTEDAGAQQFNQTLAAAMLAASAAAFYLLDSPALGWALALVLAGVAFLATRGLCIGCLLYYRLKRRRTALTR